jgi:pyruvate/2-oxoacid:ferredoxin oxidoreductase alpha subunit
MREVLEGSHAVSEAVRLARVQVMSAYPITPQTHIVEALSDAVAAGRINARFINVESEHSAMAACVGAAAGGVRTFTATSSHGLAYMHELLHWASASRLPIVMAEVNRALGPGWNIWMDQTDSLAQRDTGWIQIYCADAQEVLDTTLLAFRLAEQVNLPVMVVMDAFFLSHTFEPVDLPDPAEVDRFLPPYIPKFQLDTKTPFNLGQLAMPDIYMEMRHNLQATMDCVNGRLLAAEDEFAAIFGRRYGILETYKTDDAEIVLIMAGTMAGTCAEVIDDLREAGEKVGLIRLRLFRPFPVREIREAVSGAKKAAVIDRNCSFGAGGIFAQEIRAALCNVDHPPVYGYIAGLGGRDVTPEILQEIHNRTKSTETPEAESVWIGVKENYTEGA